MTLDDSDKEALADLVHSEGWTILWTKVMEPLLKSGVNDGMQSIRGRDLHGAMESIAKVDSAVQVAIEAYKAAGEKPPQTIMNMRRA